MSSELGRLTTNITKVTCLFLATVTMETSLFPVIVDTVRIDLFIGLILGMVIATSFGTAGILVIVFSFLLQAFSGASLGSLPFIYLTIFLGLTAAKNMVYLENTISQMVLGTAFYVLGIVLFRLFIPIHISLGFVASILASSVLTGLTTPLIVYMVRMLWREDEA